MTLQQLRYIVILDQERHFANAAERCSVSQPGLTIQLKKLEEEIGLMIFDRSKVPLKPTPLGKEIVELAKRVLHDVDSIKDFVVTQKSMLTGTLTMGVVSTLAPYLIPISLKAMRQALPKVKLIIREATTVELMNKLEIGEIDVALMATPTGNSRLKEYPVFDEPFVAYLPALHVQSQRPFYTLDPEDVNKLLILEDEYCYNSQLLNICELKTKSSSNFLFDINSIETLKNMVKSSHGFAIIPWLAQYGQSPSDQVLSKPFEGSQPVREISLVTSDTFSRKLLLEKLSKAIWESLPSELKNLKDYRKIRWNDSPYWAKSSKQI
ncbi:hydrogen peroxide-inducible genes activator [Marinoscillum pacificum]|uniref:hydrogen peroxide-inducible genes activator n=1 Tax=Marinoscillum pacificum TaxID=392723 RepID=UPI002157F918|nr:hydrogen peroxide-inducible genes activator [Marinoscillum pacificum]